MSELALHLTTPLATDEVRVWTVDTGERERVRAIARVLLAPQLGVEPARVALERTAAGKPYVASDETLHYSVSHSAAHAMIALTRVAPVGVDIERVRVVPNAERILARFFPQHQIDAILSDDRRELRFVQAWTEAEARVKARGAGMWHVATPDERAVLRPLTAPDGYAASVAVLASEWRVTQYALAADALDDATRHALDHVVHPGG
jgi:phosphopantetheinyl transferase